MNLRSTGIFLLVMFSFAANAQHPATDSLQKETNFYDLSLQQLMNLEISVASIQTSTPRESPGIVTLITGEEIQAMGARDLVDVLKMIPGFDFCVDVQGVVGIAVRGNWAHEGKALLIIDGIEMNENLYSTLQFGNHYPVDDIRRIEIIRGPGSAIYGGNAEYAVINITTRNGEDISGGQIKANYGQMESSTGRHAFSLSAGNQWKHAGFSAFYQNSKAIRSDRDYHDLWNSTYSMEDNSTLNSHYFNMGLQVRKFHFRGIFDQYEIESRDNYDMALSQSYRILFKTYAAELKNETALGKKLVLTPRVSMKIQFPWQLNDSVANDEVNNYDVKSTRYTGSVQLAWNATEKFHMVSGAEYFYDIAEQQRDVEFWSTQSKYLDYSNTSFFTQATMKTRIANFTGGARYNINQMYDNSFVPRLSATRIIGKMHFKLLYSQAYRAPNTENIDINTSIKPERTTVEEFEAGWMIRNNMYVTFNAFDITTIDPIIYYYDNATDWDGYRNAGKSGTKGFEVRYQWKSKPVNADLNYGFYTARHKNRLPDYKVPGDRDALLAIPNHKVTFACHINSRLPFTIHPSLTWYGARYSITSLDVNDQAVIEKTGASVYSNLVLRFERLVHEAVSGSIGVYNITGEDIYYYQPYTGSHAGLPGPSREVYITFSYHFNRK